MWGKPRKFFVTVIFLNKGVTSIVATKRSRNTKSVFTQPLLSPSIFPTVLKCHPQLICLVSTPRHTLLFYSRGGSWTFFVVLTNEGFTSKKSTTPKMLYCTECANNYFVEVKMRIKPLLCTPFICGFQSTQEHSCALTISILRPEKLSVQAVDRCSPFQIPPYH